LGTTNQDDAIARGVKFFRQCKADTGGATRDEDNLMT
jgi:hypothetical protein